MQVGTMLQCKIEQGKASRTFDHIKATSKSKRFNARQCGPVYGTLA